MATLGDIAKTLDKKSIEQIKEMYAYARSKNFDIGWFDQSKDIRPRIYIIIYPEGKEREAYRNNMASWYFYLKLEDIKDNFGNLAQPENFRGGGKSFKNFKRFMTAVKERYDRDWFKKKIAKIINSIMNEN
jgi:hypothetical protein